MPKAHSQTTFQESYNKIFPWVAKDEKSNNVAICTWCRKTIHIGSMGKKALESHENNKNHKQIASSRQNSLVFNACNSGMSVLQVVDSSKGIIIITFANLLYIVKRHIDIN